MNERDSHMDQVMRWAKFVRDNPTTWKKIHTDFINAIFEKHEQFVQRLKASPGGEEKLRQLQEMRRRR